jgi:hypothetical protein
MRLQHLGCHVHPIHPANHTCGGRSWLLFNGTGSHVFSIAWLTVGWEVSFGHEYTERR